MKELQPINENVLIELVEEKEQKTTGGIIIPDTASKEKPISGKVIAMANIQDPEFNVGDNVVFKKYSGTELEFEDKQYLVIQYSDILAKIVETDSI